MRGGIRAFLFHPPISISLIHRLRDSRLWPAPYDWPTVFTDQPPKASVASLGQSTARKRSLRLCLKECTTYSLPILTFNHLFNLALTELDLRTWPLQKLGNAKLLPLVDIIRFAAHRADPIRGTFRLLPIVFKRRQG